MLLFFNPIALKKAKIVCNFGLSECNIGLMFTEVKTTLGLRVKANPSGFTYYAVTRCSLYFTEH